MSGVNDIIAYGFGPWSTVAKVPTLGFGISAVVIVAPGGIELCLANTSPKYRVMDTSPGYRVADTSPGYRVSEV